MSASVLCGEKLETYLRAVIFLSLKEKSKGRGFFFTSLLQDYMWKWKLFHADFLVLSGVFRYNPYTCS